MSGTSEEEKNISKANGPREEYTAMQKPGGTYKTVTISSPEEMRLDNYRHWLSLTPEQRLAEHYVLITHIYKDQLEQNQSLLYDKIYFHE